MLSLFFTLRNLTRLTHRKGRNVKSKSLSSHSHHVLQPLGLSPRFSGKGNSKGISKIAEGIDSGDYSDSPLGVVSITEIRIKSMQLRESTEAAYGNEDPLMNDASG